MNIGTAIAFSAGGSQDVIARIAGETYRGGVQLALLVQGLIFDQ